MNKRGEFLARDFIIILIVFGAVALIGFLVAADISSQNSGYNTPNVIDSKFSSNYDTLSDSASRVYKMQNATSSPEGLSSVSSTIYVFRSVFSIISLIFGSVSMVNNVFVNFATDFGMPTIIANILFPAIITILLTLLIFVIISSVSQGKL